MQGGTISIQEGQDIIQDSKVDKQIRVKAMQAESYIPRIQL